MVRRVVLLVGTRRGLFRFVSDTRRESWSMEGPHIPGYEVYHVFVHPRDGRTGFAAVRHPVWGAHLYGSADAGASWEPRLSRPRFPEGSGREVRAIWHLAPAPKEQRQRLYAGVEPAALFVSDDGGTSWRWIRELDDHSTRAFWQPAKGGLALHSIQPDPEEPARLYVAVSAGGCYRTEDEGASWTPINRGVRADYLPDPLPEAGHCTHSLRVHPRRTERLYRQSHCGTYRSDDHGDSWTEVTGGLPSEFGYVVGLDPSDPDRCWVIPEHSSHMRSVCEGRLRVFETRDGGNTWEPRAEGLPRQPAYVSILREALATDGLDPCGVYFGTSSGHLFASADGERWRPIGAFLPKILSVWAGPVTGLR